MKVSVSPERCANNIHPLMGRVNMTFCSHFMMCVAVVIILNMSNYCIASDRCCGKAPLLTLCSFCTTGFISMNHYCATAERYKRRAVLVSVSPGFFATFVQSDATSNRLCALCFLNPDSFFALCFHFTGGLPYGRGCVCFI